MQNKAQFLISDAAMGLSRELLEIVKPCLNPTERIEAIGLFYLAAKAALERYEVQADRLHRRIHPSSN